MLDSLPVIKSLEELAVSCKPPIKLDKLDKDFLQRLNKFWPDVSQLMTSLYLANSRFTKCNFELHLFALLKTIINAHQQRSESLTHKDHIRLNEPDWIRDENRVGMSCYINHFAGSLNDVKVQIAYLKELGITYLHFMPFYASPDQKSDGGYAVADYRSFMPFAGSREDFIELRKALDEVGIVLALDFVLNHTSDEHSWALQAKAGNKYFQDFYYLFDSEEQTLEYQSTLREIFPELRKGNFSYCDKLQQWVWTTFHDYQWDLNYTNPAVTVAMVEEMCYLANLGVDVLRLDSVAFIWKQQGTNCENLPQAHILVSLLKKCLSIVAPAVVFKSEAIVHPDEVIKYIDSEKCQLSYNPMMTALLWQALAAGNAFFLQSALTNRFKINADCAWVNYIRCHDDIGWIFSDEDAAQLGLDATDLRHQLNRFYTQNKTDNWPTGVAFQKNSSTGDCRVCGSLASLCGLEKALIKNDQYAIQTAANRIYLLHAVICSIGGLPLLYAGDELGITNQYQYQQEPEKQHDDRWVNRPLLSDEIRAKRHDKKHISSIIFCQLQKIIAIRKRYKALGKGNTIFIQHSVPELFAFQRIYSKATSLKKDSEQKNDGYQSILVLANFSDQPINVTSKDIPLFSKQPQFTDCLTETKMNLNKGIKLASYQIVWLKQSD